MILEEKQRTVDGRVVNTSSGEQIGQFSMDFRCSNSSKVSGYLTPQIWVATKHHAESTNYLFESDDGSLTCRSSGTNDVLGLVFVVKKEEVFGIS